MTYNNAIEVCDLCKGYDGKNVVDHLSFTVPSGALFALLGVNGAGKTTTIRMLCGLTEPDQGDAVLMGHSITADLISVKANIAVSPQENAVAPNLSVRENLELIAELTLHGREMIIQRVESILDELSLRSYEKIPARKLSGGYQRRLSIAMALICKPSILFLDEPTLGLDVLARRDLWKLLEKLKGKITILLTTHYMEEAQALADIIGIMSDGKMKVTGTVQQLCDKTGRQNLEEAFLAYVQEDNL